MHIFQIHFLPSAMWINIHPQGTSELQTAPKSTRWKSPPPMPQTAGHESCPEKPPLYQWGEEAALPQAWDHGSARFSSQYSTELLPKTAFPEVGEGHRPGFQNRLEVSKCGHWPTSGGHTRWGCLKALICVQFTPTVTSMPKDSHVSRRMQGERA